MSKVEKIRSVHISVNDEENAFRTKSRYKTKNPRMDSKNCSVMSQASSKCYTKEKTAGIVSGKKRTHPHPRRQSHKKLYKSDRISQIKEGQWDNYLKHAAALLLHGIQSINKEPEKRITKNSMKNPGILVK